MMTSAGSSFGGTPQPTVSLPPSQTWTAAASSGPSGFAIVGGASNVGGASMPNVGGATSSSSADGNKIKLIRKVIVLK